MDEKKLQAKKELAGEAKPSMKRRSDIHNYHGHHIYMLTLVVEGRRPLLGEVVGHAEATPDSMQAPRMELSELGKAVHGCWQQIPLFHPEVKILALQLMPDHLHGILWVKEDMEEHLGQVVSGFKAGCNKAYRRLFAAAMPQPTPNFHDGGAGPCSGGSESRGGAGPCRGGSESCGGSEYAAASPQRLFPLPSELRLKPQDRIHGLLFEKGYNDLIAKGYDMLPTLIAYVKDNPRRLLLKRAHPEYLRPFFGLRLGSQEYSGIGNRELLHAPRRMAVRVSRRLDAVALEAEVARYMQAAREGAVLVSPAISPGEKRVMRAAFNDGLPTVVIMENGFTPLSKPKGEQFDACAAGRLLMLAPWEHHNEKRKLTAYQCQQMNLMALNLCK